MNTKFLFATIVGCTVGTVQAHNLPTEENIPQDRRLTGRVYVDANRNGQYDRGERLLDGVCMSDGLHVARTKKDGTFALTGREGARFVVMTVPAGYRAATTYYKRIADNASYDFGVVPWSQRTARDGSHQFLHVADTEIFNTTNHEGWADEIRDYAQNERAVFVVHTGDICYPKDLSEHLSLMNSSNMGCPVYYGLGNHDLVKGAYGEEYFERIYGPCWYSFDVGKTHYVMLPMLGGDYRPGFRPQQIWRWLKNDLDAQPAGKSVIIFHHDLLTYDDNFRYDMGNGEFLNLNDYNVKAWVYGHWHNHFVRQQGRVRTISTSAPDKGGIDHSASAFRVISVDGKGHVATQLRYTYLNHHIQLASIGHDACAQAPDGSFQLSVNAYHTASPVERVTFSIRSDDDRLLMANRPLRQNSDWNFSTTFRLPESVKGQRVFVEATATMRNGDRASQRGSFINAPASPTPALPTSAPRPAWTTNVGGNIWFTAPVINGPRLYVATLDEELRGRAAVTCLDIASGKLLWRAPVRNSIKNRIATTHGKVFAQDGEGYLYAFDGTSGRKLWERKLDVGGLPVIVEGIMASGDTIFAGTGKGFGAYAANDGAPLWKNGAWRQNQGATSAPMRADDVVVTGTQWSGLYGHDIKDGRLLWRHEASDIRERGAAPAYADGVLYLASGNAFFIIAPQTGEILLRRALPYSVNTTATPLVTEDAIIIGTATRGIVALDRQTLEEKWHVGTGPALIYTTPYSRHPAQTVEASPILVNGIAYVGASDGRLYGIEPNTGRVVWYHNLGAPVFAQGAYADGRLFFSDYAGNVSCFRLP